MSDQNQRSNDEPRSLPSGGNTPYISSILGSLPGPGMASAVTSELDTPTTRSVSTLPSMNFQGLKNLATPVTRLPGSNPYAANNPYAASNPYAAGNPYSSFNSEPKSRIHGAVITNWSVPDGSLQCVPDYFALERTSRFVAGTGASIVSARISDCLRRRSIATKFENSKAKAKCTNGDFVQFRIRLFAGRNEYKNGVIVEVQRRSGGSLSFHRDCRAVLDSAEGLDFALGTEEDSSPKSCLSSLQLSKTIQDVETTQELLKETSSGALEIASDLLKKDRIDANILGMESLICLTDCSKAGLGIAKIVSRNIILDENSAGLRTIIMRFVSISSEDKSDQNEFRQRLHNLALHVLSNALLVTSKEGLLQREIQEHKWFADHLIPVLINELKDARNRPHDALLAAKAMFTLINISPDMRSKAIEIGAKNILTNARDHGISSHACLATETERCVSTLECAC